MTSRTPMFLVLCAGVVLSGCGDANSVADGGASSTEGVIGLAVAQTCTEGSEQCVTINGESILIPSDIEQAEVESAVVASDGDQDVNAVNVTFSEDGAAILHALTKRAARTGDVSRLIIEVDNEVVSVVMVKEPLKGNQVQIGLSQGTNAQDIVDLIHEG